MALPPPRTLEKRTRDTLHRLEHDVDAWIATADPERGAPHMVPLSFHWDGETVIVATTSDSVTGRNLGRSGLARIGLGATRDVVLIEGRVERSYPAAEIDPSLGDTFAARAGFDPRRSAGAFRYFHIRPRRVQAWREENELEGRLLMRAGRWLAEVGAAPR